MSEEKDQIAVVEWFEIQYPKYAHFMRGWGYYKNQEWVSFTEQHYQIFRYAGNVYDHCDGKTSGLTTNHDLNALLTCAAKKSDCD